MSGIGTGYDLSTTTYSPDGKVFQVDYACKAVDNGGLALGVTCSDGVVLGVEKLRRRSMLVPGRRTATSPPSTASRGMAGTGLAPDARQIVARARAECSQYLSFYGDRIPAQILADRMATTRQFVRCTGRCAPLGACALLGACTARAADTSSTRSKCRDRGNAVGGKAGGEERDREARAGEDDVRRGGEARHPRRSCRWTRTTRRTRSLTVRAQLDLRREPPWEFKRVRGGRSARKLHRARQGRARGRRHGGRSRRDERGGGGRRRARRRTTRARGVGSSSKRSARVPCPTCAWPLAAPSRFAATRRACTTGTPSTTTSTSSPSSSAARSVRSRHTGHASLPVNQGSTHAAWNPCPHAGSAFTTSPTAYDSKHTQHREEDPSSAKNSAFLFPTTSARSRVSSVRVGMRATASGDAGGAPLCAARRTDRGAPRRHVIQPRAVCGSRREPREAETRPMRDRGGGGVRGGERTPRGGERTPRGGERTPARRLRTTPRLRVRRHPLAVARPPPTRDGPHAARSGGVPLRVVASEPAASETPRPETSSRRIDSTSPSTSASSSENEEETSPGPPGAPRPPPRSSSASSASSSSDARLGARARLFAPHAPSAPSAAAWPSASRLSGPPCRPWRPRRSVRGGRASRGRAPRRRRQRRRRRRRRSLAPRPCWLRARRHRARHRARARAGEGEDAEQGAVEHVRRGGDRAVEELEEEVVPGGGRGRGGTRRRRWVVDDGDGEEDAFPEAGRARGVGEGVRRARARRGAGARRESLRDEARRTSRTSARRPR